MTKYLIHVTASYAAKNELHKEIQNFFIMNNLRLFRSFRIINVVLQDHIQRINKEYPHIEPITIHFQHEVKQGRIYINGLYGIISVELLCATDTGRFVVKKFKEKEIAQLN